MRRSHRGFTLIELLVVVAIIALLLSILLPSLGAAREQTKRAKCSANLRSIVQAMILYSLDNRDIVPQHEGVEPSYVYVRKGDSGDLQWHLAELILPYMSVDPPGRGGPDGTFTERDLELAKPQGSIFYCPSTNNVDSNREASWSRPSTWGAFMDYAQIWNFVGPAATVTGDRVYLQTTDGLYHVFDDEQAIIFPDQTNPLEMHRLPFKTSAVRFQLPKSDAHSRVPVIQDYLVSVGRDPGSLPADFDSEALRPTAGNHLWTGRANAQGASRVKGGNFAYEDGSAAWRSAKQLRPRLMINRQFADGSTRPTYWW